MHSLAELGSGVLQNAQMSFAPLSTMANIQPMQISFPQHEWKANWSALGKGSMQMGHSSGGRGSLNNFSSYNSATRLSHFFLCFDRCFFLQAALQYLTESHLLHAFILSPPSLPQFAHVPPANTLFSSPIFSEDNAPEKDPPYYY